MMWTRTPVLGLLLLLALAHPAVGQRRDAGFLPLPPPPPPPAGESLQLSMPAASRGPGAGSTVLGATLGAAAGTLAGGLIGGAITGNDCDPGNPDACLGEAIPGLLVGAGIGYAVGAPVGAHLGNGRRGRLGRSLLVSSALFGVQAVTLALVGEEASTRLERSAIPLVFLAIPAAQLVSAVVIERRTAGARDGAQAEISVAR